MRSVGQDMKKKGMKTMFGKRYPNCVKKVQEEEVKETSSLEEKVKIPKHQKILKIWHCQRV